MREELRKIEAVLEERVRPALRAHGGEIEIDRLEEGVLYVKLLGQALPELVRKVAVVQTVSDELWKQAKKLLREHRL